MPDSVQSPIVYVYDINRTLLATNLEKNGLGIVSFKYTFDDEDDDLCHIKIQSSNIEMLEFIQKDFVFETGVRLIVRWGYMKGELNNYQTVVIRDVKTKYGSNVIWTELECSDLVTYLKTTKSPDSANMSLLDYLETYTFQRYNIAVVEHGKLVYVRKLGKTKSEKAEADPLWKNVDSMHPLEPLFMYQQNFDTGVEKVGYVVPKGSSGDILFDKVPMVPQYKVTYNENLVTVPDFKGRWVGEEDSLYQYFTTEFPVTGVNRSPFIVITDRLRAAPGGPWYVTGRGNLLFIHNRNLGGKPFRYYEYAQEPGNLIDFTFTSKYESFAKRTVTFAGMSPLEKTVHYLDNYVKWLEDKRGIKDILEDRTISRPQMRKELQDWFDVYLNSYARWKATATPVALLESGKSTILSEKEHEDTGGGEDIEKGQLAGMTVRPDGTYHYEVPPQFKHTDPRFGLWGLDPVVAFSYVYSAPVESLTDAGNILDSANRKLEMDKEEAKIILIGDPHILSELTVHISNIQKFQVGTYYVKSCVHTISNQGYKVTLDTIRVRDEAKATSFHSILEADENTGEMGIADRYRREGELFRRWNISIYKQTPSGTAGAYDVTGGASFSSIQKGESRFNILDDVTNMEEANRLIEDELLEKYGRSKKFTIVENDPGEYNFADK